MKTVLFVVVAALAAVATPAAANWGWIGLFAEPGGCVCDIDDRVPGLLYIYVVHRDMTEGVEGSRFTISGYALAYLTFLYEDPIGDTFILGSIVDGYTVSYGECVTSGLAIMEIVYFGSGLTPDCSDVSVVAAPSSETGQVEVFDCNDDVQTVPGYTARVNATPDCSCTDPYCYPVPVGASTWGGIKALYR